MISSLILFDHMDENIERFWAGGFLYDKAEKRILLHKRDAKTGFNPNKWAFFGGSDNGDELPYETFIREFKEETEVVLVEEEARFLGSVYQSNMLKALIFFAYKSINTPITLHEGADFGWFTFEEAMQLDIVPLCREKLTEFRSVYEA